MKKFFVLCAVVLIAVGCQKKGGSTQVEYPVVEFHETNLATDSLPTFTKDVLVFKTFPPEGSTTNLFVHDATGDKPFLPKDYYYVPDANRDDAKPALLPDVLLVQKGSALSFFNTKDRGLTSLTGITVPAYATVIALNSMSGGSNMVIVLMDKDQFSPAPHPSVMYLVNRDTAAAKQITNPVSDNLTATSNRFPIASSLYDGKNNRILQLVFQENAGYTGVQSFDLDNGSRAELEFSEPSGVNVTPSYLTVYARDNSKNTIGAVDVIAEKLALIPLTVPEYKKTANSAFMNYSYLGKGYLASMEYMQDNSIQFTMLHEEQGEVLKPIHAASLPYTFMKLDTENNLYMVLSSPELMETRIAQYSIASNRFTGVLTVPGVSSGEVEFLK